MRKLYLFIFCIILVFIFCIYLITAFKFSVTSLNWIYQIPIAHRGFHGEEIIENSLEAIEKAIYEKKAIELDIMLSSDEKVLVYHDKNANRLLGIKKEVSLLSYEQMKQSAKKRGFTLPLLQDVLTKVRGQVPIYFEIKNEKKPGVLEEKVYQLVKNYSGSYAIMSFNPYVLEWFYKRDKSIIRGLVSGSFKKEKKLAWYKKFVLKHLLMNFKSKPHFIAYEKDSINSIHVQFLRYWKPVLVWTIKNEEELKHLQGNYDNYIFDPWF